MTEPVAEVFAFAKRTYLAAIEEKLRRLLLLGKVPAELLSWREGPCECTRVGDETFRWCMALGDTAIRLERDRNVPDGVTPGRQLTD